MPYETDPHALWVSRFTGGAVDIPAEITGADRQKLLQQIQDAENAIADQAIKDKVIADAREKVIAKRDEIRAAFVYDMKAEGKTMSTLGAGGDQTQAVDPDEAGQRMDEAISQAQMVKGIEMEDFFTAIEKELKEHKKTGSTEPLLSAAEIRDEIFTPLVREQLIPEQFLRNRFSDVQQMLDATSDAYLEELKRYGGDDEKSETAENAKEVIEGIKGVAEAIAGLSEEHKELKEGAINLIAALATTGVDVYAAASEEPGFNGLETVIKDLGKVAKAALPKPIGAAISLGISSSMDATALVVHLSKEGGPDTQAFAQDIVNLVDDSIEAFALKLDNKAKTRAINKIRQPVKTVIETAIKSGPGLVKDVQDRNWAGIGKLVKDAVIKGLRVGFKLAAEDEKAGLDEDEEKDEVDERTEAVEEALDEASDLANEAFEISAERQEELERLAAEDSDADLAEMFAMSTDSAAEVAAAEAREYEEQAAAEQRQYELALEGLDAEDPDANQLKSIGALIAKMEKDRAVMKAVLAVAQGSVAVVTQFFSPMAAAGTLVGFLENLHSALERCKAMRRWQASHGEAIAAVSPYATSIANFVKNQKEQFAQETIQAGFKVLKLGAQIAGSTGFLTHAAKVAEAGIGLVATAEELIYKHYKRGQLEAAWIATESALRNPNNRRLGLIARSLNPTLAKYSIAWGAMVKRDAMAVAAVSRIGLTRETLEMESTSVSEVKRYLETLYEDDNKVVKEFDDGTWPQGKPPHPQLDVKSWTSTVAAAKANGKLDDSEHGEIVRGLKLHGRLAVAFDRNNKAGTCELTAVMEYANVLKDLADAFAAYRPKSIAVESKAMVELTEGFAVLVDARLFAVEQVRLDLAESA